MVGSRMNEVGYSAADIVAGLRDQFSKSPKDIAGLLNDFGFKKGDIHAPKGSFLEQTRGQLPNGSSPQGGGGWFKLLKGKGLPK